MRQELADMLRCPETLEELALYAFKSDGRGVQEGLLIGQQSHKAYAVLQGVPVMIWGTVPEDFRKNHHDQLDRLRKEGVTFDFGPHTSLDWSFSREWDAYYAGHAERTWGFLPDARRRMMLQQLQLAPEECPGKIILDAGCGNGIMAQAISQTGATVIAIDYSTGVFPAEAHRESETVHYVRGDLQKPPFAEETFDYVYSSGVLHHTPNTRVTFDRVVPLVKKDGKCYVWLYRKPEDFLTRIVKHPYRELKRFIISRAPGRVQDACVHVLALADFWRRKLTGRRTLSFAETVVAVYDRFTPRWRYCHTPYELAGWFHEAGFSQPVLSHWDNRDGFGVTASRSPEKTTPGLNFEKSAEEIKQRYDH